jgi:integrase
LSKNENQNRPSDESATTIGKELVLVDGGLFASGKLVPCRSLSAPAGLVNLAEAVRKLKVPRAPATVVSEPLALGAPVSPAAEATSQLWISPTFGDLTPVPISGVPLHLDVYDRDRAQRRDVRDLVLWLRQAPNPQRVRTRSAAPVAGSVNRRTGKPYLAAGYAPRTINHQLAVLSHFYDFHLGAGRGLVGNPVPTATRGGTRPGAHGNPLLEFAPHRRGAYRQKVPDQTPRVVSDELWNELFASMTSHRDRAILATYISSAARAAELLGMCCGDVDFGRQTISVIGKGTRTRQTVPASPDAFVWIRLYLAEGHVAPSDEPLPAAAPLWVTLRGPRRPLNYSAMRAVLNRANDKLGANITLHDLRHTCAARMMADPNMAITDVQAVLRHKSLATTGKYGTVALDELINRTLEHHARRAAPPPPRPHPAYDATDLAVLFGQQGG